MTNGGDQAIVAASVFLLDRGKGWQAVLIAVVGNIAETAAAASINPLCAMADAGIKTYIHSVIQFPVQFLAKVCYFRRH